MPNSEGRAGMAAIVDKDNTLDISTLSDGLQKALPSYARPLFIRKLSEVEMTGNLLFCPGSIDEKETPHLYELLFQVHIN